MDLSRPETAATDWTVQAGILGVTGAVFGALGGLIAHHAGYFVLLVIALFVSITGILAVWRYFRRGYLGAEPEPQPMVAVPSQDFAS
jgi:hypothetical protein